MAAVPLLRATCCFNSISSVPSSRLLLPSSFLRHSPSSSQPLLCLKKRYPLTPFAASTSEWAQQEGEEQEGEEQLGWVNGDSYDEQVVGGDGYGSEESYTERFEDTKIYVGNLPFDMDSDGLGQLFEQAGVVDVAEVIYNRQTDRSRGYGFVTFRTVEELEKAMEMFNGYECNGRTLIVNKALQRRPRSERRPSEFTPLTQIYVGNLHWQVDDAQLMRAFSKYGKVVSARVVCDRQTGRSRGFGFVTMSTQPERDNAVTALDGEPLEGRIMRVHVAQTNQRGAYF